MTHETEFDPIAAGWRVMRGGDMPGGIGQMWSRRHDDTWRYGMQTVESHANPGGVVHGGILMTFADHGLSTLAWEAAHRATCTTIQLNTHFLDAVRLGSFVHLRGEVTRRTRGMVFLRGLLAVGDHDVAAVDGIWRILRTA